MNKTRIRKQLASFHLKKKKKLIVPSPTVLETDVFEL